MKHEKIKRMAHDIVQVVTTATPEKALVAIEGILICLESEVVVEIKTALQKANRELSTTIAKTKKKKLGRPKGSKNGTKTKKRRKKSSFKKWTKQEDNILKSGYPMKVKVRLLKKFGRSTAAVKTRYSQYMSGNL